MQMPVETVRDTLELPVNGKRDLFVQKTCKRKTGSIRFDHSDIFTSVSARETVKTMMNLRQRQHDADTRRSFSSLAIWRCSGDV
jgi:hypothetical protein